LAEERMGMAEKFFGNWEGRLVLKGF